VLPSKAVTLRPHDALFKAGFEKPEHAAGIFRGILPASLVDAIAWGTMRLAPGSLIDPALSDRHSDLLYEVDLHGAPAFLYVLLEHQSTNDPDMALRMLIYMTRIWERFRKEHPVPDGGRVPLPPIIPVLVSHAPGGWTAPRSFEELFEPHPAKIPGLAAFVPRFSMLVEDLEHLSNDDIKALTLAAFPKLVLWALRDARSGPELLRNFAQWGAAMREAWRAPYGVEALGQLLRYIELVCDELQLDEFRAKLRELAPEVEQAAMTIAEQMRREGAAEGRAEGRVEGRVQVLSKQLTLKFGAIGAEHEALINAATDEDLDRYVERVLTAETLAAVFAK
jgi:hypothetical protein